MNEHPWTECLDFYFSEWRAAPLLLQVDLGAGEVAPMRTHPLRIQARIPMARARADGLRARSEAGALFRLEDALCEEMGEVAPLLYVGRIVGLGEVTLVWYAPAVVTRLMEPLAAASRQAVARSAPDTPPECGGEAEVEPPRARQGGAGPAFYSVVLSQTEDPDWSFYFDFLYPDVYNLQVMLNRRRLLTLVDHGDDGGRRRPLEHRAWFPSREAARQSARALRRAGFQVETIGPEEQPGRVGSPWERDDVPPHGGARQEPADPEVECWFLREDALAGGRIDDVCVEILDAILPHEGHYEGWSSPILPG